MPGGMHAERRVGYQVPSVEVRFRDLHIETSVFTAAGAPRPPRPPIPTTPPPIFLAAPTS